MDRFTPTILTSRAASKDYEFMKAKHSSLLNDMQNHQMRVQAFNAQKDMERQQTMMMQNEQATQMRKEQADQQKMQNESQKTAMEMDLKTKELAVKQAALSLE